MLSGRRRGGRGGGADDVNSLESLIQNGLERQWFEKAGERGLEAGMPTLP